MPRGHCKRLLPVTIIYGLVAVPILKTHAQTPPAVNIDKLIDDFLKIDLNALKAKDAEYKKLVAEGPGQAKALRDKAAGLDGQVPGLQKRLDMVGKLKTARGNTPPAPAPSPTSQPSVDHLVDALLSLDPKALAAKEQALTQQIGKLQTDAKNLTSQAAAIDATVAAARKRLTILPKLITALSPPPPPKQAAAHPPPKPPGNPDMKTAAADTAASVATPQADATPQPAQPPVATGAALNFDEHIVPLLTARCTGCHNPDKAKGGLDMITFEPLMTGGSSGEVIRPGDGEASRLVRLISHLEEPTMPPLESKLPDEQIAMIRAWVDQGAAATAKSGPTEFVEAEVPDPTPRIREVVSASNRKGPPPMPENLAAAAHTGGTHAPAVRALAVSPTAPLAAASGTREILMYDLETRRLLGALPFDGTPEDLEFSIDGRVLVCAGGETGKSGVVVAYDVRTGERLGEYGQAYDTLLAVALSPDGAIVAAGGPSRKVRAYDTDGGSLLYEITAHNDWIYALAINEYGDLLATGDRAGNLFVWESDTGREVHVLRGHAGAISGLSFHGETDILASASEDGTVRLWEMEDGRQIRSWGAHDVGSLDVSFAADGRLATSGADRRVRVWQQDGKRLANIENLSDWVYRVAFAAKGAQVVAGTWDGALGIWEAASGKSLGTLDPSS